MNSVMFWIRDRWGRWAVDRAGVQSGKYSLRDLRSMLEAGELTPHSWLRHYWTGRFSLVGEVLYGNQLATQEEFEAWFPEPRIPRPRRPKVA
jgi:hypothetical protein